MLARIIIAQRIESPAGESIITCWIFSHKKDPVVNYEAA